MENLSVAPAVSPDATRQIWSTTPTASIQTMTEGAVDSKLRSAFLNRSGITGQRVLGLLGFGEGIATLRKKACRREHPKSQPPRLAREAPISCHILPRRTLSVFTRDFHFDFSDGQ
jgi:hypothetical protein